MTAWKNQKGASAVEFAIILPILIALFFGIVDFGLLIYDKQVITNASREGARAGIVQRIPRLSVAGITGVVNDYAASHLVTFGSGTSPTTTVPSGSCASFGQDLDVIVSYNYNFLAVRTIAITAQTTMKCE
ncbi:MAG: pilus assembly protein [Deltaproteobacteria bacterium]|nr:pilus assembly protein [Deltaproteobacteria bacterium]